MLGVGGPHKIYREVIIIPKVVSDQVKFSDLVTQYRRSHECTERIALEHGQEILNEFMSRSGAGALLIDVNCPPDKGVWNLTGAKNGNSVKNVTIARGGAAHFRDGCFGEVKLQGTNLPVLFSGALIAIIWTTREGVSEHPNSWLKFQECWIREFRMDPGSIIDLAFFGGGIFNLRCPAPADKSPFRGSVSFSGVFLPRTRTNYDIGGAQPYRNMRYHLSQLQNGPAASVFHSAELAVERDDERGLNWLFNFLYEEFSDYGASPVLPLVWIGLLWLLTATVLFASGVNIGGTSGTAVGWQVCLYEAGWKGELLRSVILGFQPISWLGSLLSSGPSVPLVPHSFFAQIWLVIDGILSTVLLALFIFALRRRFRMAS